MNVLQLLLKHFDQSKLTTLDYTILDYTRLTISEYILNTRIIYCISDVFMQRRIIPTFRKLTFRWKIGQLNN